MAINLNDLAGALMGAQEQPAAPRASRDQYGTIALDAEGTPTVMLDGGEDYAPCTCMVGVHHGDRVLAHVVNHKIVVFANITAPTTDDATALVAIDKADAAAEAADKAGIAAASAQGSADDAAAAARAADQKSAAAGSAAAAAQTSADNAATAAASAQTSADNAATAANKATYALSDVEKVVGTVNWIAEHGSYELTQDAAIVPGKVYYTRSGTAPDYVYTVVANPDASGLATYYELELDESVQNFLASHLWLDNYGLNLSVDSANGYRIHQGTVDGTKAVGTYVIGPDGDVVSSFNASGTEFFANGTSMAEFGGSGARIGDADECHVELDSDSLNFVSANSVPLVTMRIDPDSAQYWETTFTSDGTTAMYRVDDADRFAITPGTMTGYVVMVDGERTSSGAIQYSTTGGVQYIWGVFFAPGTIPEAGAQIVLSVTAAARASLIVGNGRASVNPNVGNNTIIAGNGSFASGDNSIAAGYGAGATGKACAGFGSSRATADYAFAAGLGSEATGQYSVALGYTAYAHAAHAIAIGRGVNAKSESQTVFGKYNENDTNGDYALIIGNGTADYTQARSNALAVRWNGLADVAGETAYPLFVYTTAPDVADLPVTPCFVLATSDYTLLYYDGQTVNTVPGSKLVMQSGNTKVYASGKVVTVAYDATIASKNTWTYLTDVIPAEYRPPTTLYNIGFDTGNRIARMLVNSGGQIGGYATVAGAHVYGLITYMVM